MHCWRVPRVDEGGSIVWSTDRLCVPVSGYAGMDPVVAAGVILVLVILVIGLD